MRSINDYIPTLICDIVTVYILISLYKTAIKEGRTLQMILFAFATAGLLLSGLYWLAYDLLYPMQRMPFAANEMAEWAMFLSLATILSSIHTTSYRSAKWEIVFAVIFTAANVALWIAWSGEWMQDIVTGIMLGYFYINLVRIAKETGAFPRPVWIALGLLCVVIIAANVATFHVSEAMASVFDTAAYILLSIVELYFMIRSILSLYKKEDPKTCICLSFIVTAWSFTYMYMSAGMFYNMANLGMSISFLLMYFSLKREVTS
ncbi:MAG: hypothetical protein K6G22_07850 [Lachnospiraceae bacterium]|nr:hypothetical protein [Lachnospiraceae bacterium]